MAKVSIPQGTRDFGPDVVRKRMYILNTIRSVFERYGFQPLETPAMENLSTLLGKYGDEGKVMGLAPLGTDAYHDFFEKMLIAKKDGFELNPDYFLPFGANQGMEINDAGEMIVHRLYSDKFIKDRKSVV